MAKAIFKPDSTLVSSIIAVSFFMAFGFWVLEAYFDSLFIGSASFAMRLFPADSHELWMRGVICTLIAVFGLYSGYLRWRVRALEKLNADAGWLLQRAISKTIRGHYPVCASCKKIRDDDGFWTPVEHFISVQTDATLLSSLCDDCRPHSTCTESKD